MDDGMIGYLKTRRTIPSALMGDPIPDAEAVGAILEIAARVPDHGKLAPWRFIVYGRNSRAALVEGLTQVADGQDDEKERRMRASQARAWLDAPLIVAVVSAPVVDHPKIPLWEQQLSAGAVCLNLIHAAHAHGFAAQWVTGWAAYDEAAARWLGLAAGERVAGFIHIGTPQAPPVERDRPDLAAISSAWSPGAAPATRA